MKTNMRRGFTMIELIFVIVIIGILAAVAIPKMAATRTNATATTCTHELGQFVGEVSAKFTSEGGTLFLGLPLTDITNLDTYVPADKGKGITATTSGTTIAYVYFCDGEEIGTISVDTTNATLSAVPAEAPVATKAEATSMAKQVIFKLKGSIFNKTGTEAKVVTL